MIKFNFIREAFLITLLVTLAGCTIHPAGEREERQAAERAGSSFEKRIDDRQIVPLPADPTREQLVIYAMLNSASLEQRYWEWRAAIEQIPQDGTQSASLNFSAAANITNGRAGWNTTTLGLSNDPMTDIKVPGKLDAAARASLENARAAGRRFLKARYELRGAVLTAYDDYALSGELIRLEQGEQQLLRTASAVTEARSRAGHSGQQDVLKARNEVDLAASGIANMESQLPGQRAAINALLGRPVDALLPMPRELPVSQPLRYGDEELIALAARKNPELQALADEIRGRADGLQLARLQYVPDFNLSAGTDLMGITQSILGQVTIPVFRYEALNAAIAQAQANLRAAEAMRRQTSADLAAQVIVNLAIIRDADRQLDLFARTILPRTHQMVDLGRSAYETGGTSLLDWLDDQRSLIAIERLTANLNIERDKRLVDLETITTTDRSRPKP